MYLYSRNIVQENLCKNGFLDSCWISNPVIPGTLLVPSNSCFKKIGELGSYRMCQTIHHKHCLNQSKHTVIHTPAYGTIENTNYDIDVTWNVFSQSSLSYLNWLVKKKKKKKMVSPESNPVSLTPQSLAHPYQVTPVKLLTAILYVHWPLVDDIFRL